MLHAASSNLILVLEAMFLTSEAFGTRNHMYISSMPSFCLT